jgi:hypothetical protein
MVSEILDKQLIQCKNQTFHCEWVGKLADLNHHLDQTCTRQLVKCSNLRCDANIFREDLSTHERYCEYRIISCPDCEVPIAYVDIKQHQEECPKFKLPCPQECGVLIERMNIAHHFEHDCLNTVVCCPFTKYGCLTKVTKRDLSAYLASNIDNHHLKMLNFLDKQENKLNTHDFKLNELDEIINKLRTDLEELSKEQSNLSRISKKLTPDKENKSDIKNDKYLNKKRMRDEVTPETIIFDLDTNTTIIEKEKTGIIDKEKEIEKGELREKSNLNSQIKTRHVELSFDKENISRGLTVTGNKAFCNNNPRSEHRYAFITMNLGLKEKEWRITMTKLSTWMALGVCYKENVIENKYRFATSVNFANHAIFGISTNGYKWNYNNPSENNTTLENFPILRSGDWIQFRYLPSLKELHMNIANKYQCILTQVILPVKGSLVPCVVFLNNNDEVIVE